MIRAIITMLCGIVSLACILWQQHYIQLQNEQIRQLREVLSLRDEQMGIYESIHLEQAKQIGLLKEYAAMLRQEAGRKVIDAEAAANVARIEAEAAAYAGEKEATANEKIAASLTTPLIEYYKVQRWDGKLPTVSGTDSMVVLGDIEGEAEGK